MTQNTPPKLVNLSENINENLGVAVKTSKEVVALHGRGAVTIAKGAVDITEGTINYVGNAYELEIHSIQNTPEKIGQKKNKPL